MSIYKKLDFDFPQEVQWKKRGMIGFSWHEWIHDVKEERITKQAAHLAKDAYLTHSEMMNLKQLDGGATILVLIPFGSSDTLGKSYGFVAIVKDEDGIYAAVAFRGTTGSLTGKDWLTDFNFPLDNGIHRGFKARVEEGISEWSEILLSLKKDYDFGEILFTGHSLGAAESSVSAVYLHDLRKAGKFDIGEVGLHVINFASPRPGNKTFMERHGEAVGVFRRIVNPADGVTNVPPRVGGFTHADNGILLYPGAIPGSGISFAKFDISDKFGRGGLGLRYDEAFAASVAGSLVLNRTQFHSMDLYQSRVLEAFKCSEN